ncbi:hypothetical protein IJT93_04005 [bacterium]|nr:hypothetical protein [bacterium]
MKMKAAALLLIAALTAGGVGFMIYRNSAEAANSGLDIPEPEVIDGGTTDNSSREASKEIKSRNISEFRYELECAGYSEMEEAGLEEGFYELSLRRTESGKAELTADFRSSSNEKFSVKTETPAEALDEVQKLIEEQKLAKINGWHKRNTALGCSFDLYVLYDSKETISASGEGGCSVVPDQLNPVPFLKLFKKLTETQGLRFGLDNGQAEEAE